MKNINFELQPGTNFLVKGASGSGKSTLLRAIAGIWPFVSGEIELPEQEKIMFIPQRPYLPLGTLREALLYPGTRQKTDEELTSLLELCKIESLAGNLDMEADWSHVLSIGEQQRLAFVRAIIYEPDWLFLDEATSALDAQTEETVFERMCAGGMLKTCILITHRRTMLRYCTRSLEIDNRSAHELNQILPCERCESTVEE